MANEQTVSALHNIVYACHEALYIAVEYRRLIFEKHGEGSPESIKAQQKVKAMERAVRNAWTFYSFAVEAQRNNQPISP
jgi:hypothetical protein